jgi:hypothetical protein
VGHLAVAEDLAVAEEDAVKFPKKIQVQICFIKA